MTTDYIELTLDTTHHISKGFQQSSLFVCTDYILVMYLVPQLAPTYLHMYTHVDMCHTCTYS